MRPVNIVGVCVFALLMYLVAFSVGHKVGEGDTEDAWWTLFASSILAGAIALAVMGMCALFDIGLR